MRVVYFVVNYVPHQVNSIKKLIEIKGANVFAIHKAGFKEEIPEIENFSTIAFQDYSKNELLDKVLNFQPDIVVVSGWNVPVYNWMVKKIRRTLTIPVVAMSDTPWYNTWKQKINSLVSVFHIKKLFTHIWVAGYRQYDYARKLGFRNSQIIFNSLSADTDTFSIVDIEKKKLSYPRNFLFIGRFTEVKGLGNLVQAWESIDDKKGWTFTLVGAGEMKRELKETGCFIVKDYMQQNLLIAEMQNSGCLVLPSLFEPWALVIHEAAAAGLPILCTETCGASPHFVFNEFNGFTIKDNSIEDLKIKIEKIINLNDDQLLEFSNNSRVLSSNISLDLVVASLCQLIAN